MALSNFGATKKPGFLSWRFLSIHAWSPKILLWQVTATLHWRSPRWCNDGSTALAEPAQIKDVANTNVANGGRHRSYAEHRNPQPPDQRQKDCDKKTNVVRVWVFLLLSSASEMEVSWNSKQIHTTRNTSSKHSTKLLDLYKSSVR